MNFRGWLVLVVTALFSGLILTADVSAHDKPTLSVKVGRYRLQSNPWVNLHQRLGHMPAESRLTTACT